MKPGLTGRETETVEDQFKNIVRTFGLINNEQKKTNKKQKKAHKKSLLFSLRL